MSWMKFGGVLAILMLASPAKSFDNFTQDGNEEPVEPSHPIVINYQNSTPTSEGPDIKVGHPIIENITDGNENPVDPSHPIVINFEASLNQEEELDMNKKRQLIFGPIGQVGNLGCDSPAEFEASSIPTTLRYPLDSSKYPNNADCTWSITAPGDQSILLKFSTFDLEPDTAGSCFDYVSVKDAEGSVIFLSCGSSVPAGDIVKPSLLTIQFHSDHSETASGFIATYQLVTDSPGGPAPPPAGSTTPQPPVPITPPAGSHPNCGRANHIQKRIMGGSNALQHSRPWIVHLQIRIGNAVYRCGGVLVDPQWVVTAAHCFEDSDRRQRMTDPANVDVYLGEHDVSRLVPKSPVAKVFIHPSRTTFAVGTDDIAMIELKEPVVLSDSVNTVCLPSHDNFNSGHTCDVSGWGVDENQRTQNRLMYVDLDVISNSQCRNYNSMQDISVGQVCAIKGHELKSACQGDSGGPLTCEEGGRQYLVGVVSYGYPCGMYNFAGPTVFARVFYYLDWIRSTKDAG